MFLIVFFLETSKKIKLGIQKWAFVSSKKSPTLRQMETYKVFSELYYFWRFETNTLYLPLLETMYPMSLLLRCVDWSHFMTEGRIDV